MSDQLQYERTKYLRRIRGWYDDECKDDEMLVDVYSVLVAFNVTCPAISHSLKKLLCPGQRGKGDLLSDLRGAAVAIERAIEIHSRNNEAAK